MREIKFRAKRKYLNDWVYGYYVKYNPSMFGIEMYNQHYIVDEYAKKHGINPETLGQYAERKDKNGKEIYEGDVIKALLNNGDTVLGIVRYKDAQYILEVVRLKFAECNQYSEIYTSVPLHSLNSIEIIGNIYDNPELLKEGKK